jgi:hypothetical protein
LDGDPFAASATDEQNAVSCSGVIPLCLHGGKSFSDRSKYVGIVFGLSSAVGKSVQVAGVVGSSGAEFAANWEAQKVVEFVGEFTFCCVPFAFLWVDH